MEEVFEKQGHCLPSSEASSRTRREGRHTAESSFREQQEKAVAPEPNELVLTAVRICVCATSPFRKLSLKIVNV